VDKSKKRVQGLVRQKRLLQLRERFAHLSDSAFAEMLGISADYYSRLKAYPDGPGAKAIGDKCREWEKNPTLGIDLGWFDRDEEDAVSAPHPSQLTAGALHVAYAFDQLSAAARKDIEQRIAKYATATKAPQLETVGAVTTKRKTGS
jgi:hypothetical protein